MRGPVSFLRRVAMAEAASYLLLVAVAMPLKYLAGQPMAVRIIGSIHGLLFLVFCWALLQVLLRAKWPMSRCAFVMLISFIPVVPFLFDRQMQNWENAAGCRG